MEQPVVVKCCTSTLVSRHLHVSLCISRAVSTGTSICGAEKGARVDNVWPLVHSIDQSYRDKNLAIANRSHVSCTHNTSRASVGLITHD